MVPLPPGSKIDRFEIKSLIGSGGMGTLYLARDTSPNTYRLVALKLLLASLDSADLRDRFGREARTLASLNHPNVVNIHECGDYRGAPYIVMEYVRGETVAEKIKRKAPLSLTEKLKLMMELCAGLAHAHEAGIIHRDIKPANLMVDHHGRLRLLDFGIARAVESGVTMAGVPMTQINMRIGTPGYMSPEQYEGAEIDRRSDIFAVGAVFYELLAYREAFAGTTTREIQQNVLQAEPERLTTHITGLDPQIEALVSKALQKNPDKRFQDAAEMERALTKVWWKLGLAEPSRSAPRPTPPVAGAGKKSSRADAAFKQALIALNERAPEAARRYAIEALAEDAKHEGARRFLAKYDPEFRLPNPAPPAPPPPREDFEIEPTIVSSRAGLNLPGPDPLFRSHPVMRHERQEVEPGGDETIVSAPGRRRAAVPPQQAAQQSDTSPNATKTNAPWSWGALSGSYRMAIAAAALLFVFGGAVVVAILVARWITAAPAQGELLTIMKPVNGTIVGDDIKCGTLGSACTMTAAAGTIVALELRPDTGFAAAGYTGDCAPSGRVRMSSPRACGATFVTMPDVRGAARHTLTVYAIGGGVVRVGEQDCRESRQGCSQQFAEGQQVDLEVQADSGYTFDRFSGACDADGRVLMSSPQTCGASFIPTGGVAVASNPSGGGKPGPSSGRGDPPPQGKTLTPSPTGGGEKPGGPGAPGASGGPGAPGAAGGPGAPGAASGAASGGAAAGGAAGAQTTGVPPSPPGADPKAPEGADGLPPPPPAVKAPEEVAKAEIQNVIEQYRKAYEALDFAGIRRVYPTFAAGYASQFEQYSKMTYTLAAPEFLKLDLQDHTAVVKLGVTQAFQAKGAQKEKPSPIKTVQITLHSRTESNQWVISRLEHK